jgi:hypothetical protein
MSKYLYMLEYIPEIRKKDDDEVNVKILGIFPSKKQVHEAIRTYKGLPGFREKCKVASGYDDFVEGFFISHMPVGISYWEGGFFTTSDYSYSSEQEEGEEVTLNLPYWFKDAPQELGETSEEFAERIMQQKYDNSDYPRGPESEFYQIKQLKEMQKSLL